MSRAMQQSAATRLLCTLASSMTPTSTRSVVPDAEWLSDAIGLANTSAERRALLHAALAHAMLYQLVEPALALSCAVGDTDDAVLRTMSAGATGRAVEAVMTCPAAGSDAALLRVCV